ncbi:MAG: hypothetical protein A3F70_08525 [Acidobacteria bacterium RIFCSPLOWO2_12_FULL_67_14]|nr:MAG: hypothetical protein A3F70_08525 [Acidobacteria bacterium RIFCSPLOWO2_12_FULL_67_14]
MKGAVRAVALKANTNVRALARIIEAVLGGSMLAWAFSHEGPAAATTVATGVARFIEQERPLKMPMQPPREGAAFFLADAAPTVFQQFVKV